MRRCHCREIVLTVDKNEQVIKVVKYLSNLQRPKRNKGWLKQPKVVPIVTTPTVANFVSWARNHKKKNKTKLNCEECWHKLKCAIQSEIDLTYSNVSIDAQQ